MRNRVSNCKLVRTINVRKLSWESSTAPRTEERQGRQAQLAREREKSKISLHGSSNERLLRLQH